MLFWGLVSGGLLDIKSREKGDILERRGTEAVEPDAFFGVDDGELARHGQDGAFGGGVGELGGCAADEGDDGGGVDYTVVGSFSMRDDECNISACQLGASSDFHRTGNLIED